MIQIRWKIYLGIGLLYTVEQQAFAQARDLDYETAMELASQHNPQIQNAAQNISKSASAVMVANAIFDPKITMSAGQNKSTRQQFFAGLGSFNSEVYGPTFSVGTQSTLPTGTTLSVDWTTTRTASVYKSQDFSELQQTINPFDTTLTMTLTQSLLQGYKTSYNKRQVSIAQYNLQTSEWTALETIQQVLGDTATAYWNTVHQQKLVALATEALNIAQEEQRLVEAKVQQGDIAPIEVDRIKATTLSKKLELVDAQNAYLQAKERLLILLGEDSSTTVTMTSSVPDISTLYVAQTPEEIEKELQLVREHNPTLQRLQVSMQNAEQAVQNAKHARLPDLTGTARYSMSGWEDNFTDALQELSSAALPGSYVGVNLNLPIANWNDRGQWQQRQIELEQAKLEYARIERDLLQQAQQQIRSLQSAKYKMELHAMHVDIAQKTVDSDRAIQAAGRYIQKDVQASLQALQNAQIQYEKSVSDYIIAFVNLQRLQGQLHYKTSP